MDSEPRTGREARKPGSQIGAVIFERDAKPSAFDREESRGIFLQSMKHSAPGYWFWFKGYFNPAGKPMA
jgi:hypothetical protein